MKERKPQVRRAIVRDIRISLTVWVVLEVLCFGLMPLAEAYPRDSVEPYLLPSVVAGATGVLLLSFSSGAVEDALTITERRAQLWRRRVAKVTSVLGLAGIMFPMLLILTQFWSTVRNYEG